MADENQNAPAQATPPPTFGAEPKTETPIVDTPKDGVANPPEETKQSDGQKSESPSSEPEASKPEEKKETERVVPEKYELKLSEDSYLDKRSLDRLESLAKANKMTQSEAEALVKTSEEDVKAAMSERSAMWLEETKNDREIGGANLQRNLETANRFLDKHMSKELRQDLTKTGYGNNRLFVKFVLDLAERSANDQAVHAQQSSSTPVRTEDLLYANSTSKK